MRLNAMLYKKSFSLLVVVFVLAQLAPAQQQSAKQGAVDAERLRAHITYLASDKLEGRRTGTPGAQAAAQYVADEFKRLGLSTSLQNFPYIAAVELGKGNEMEVTRRVTGTTKDAPMAIDFKVGEDWMPLGFSSNAKLKDVPFVFVGYGITAADQNHDDYKGADIAGKVALALSGTPDGDNPHGKFTRAGELRFKAAAARAAGAKALVVVASEDKFNDDKLTRLRYDNAGGDAGLPVVAISRQAAAKILGVSGVEQLVVIEKVARAFKSNNQTASGSGTQELDGILKYIRDASTALTINTDIVRKNAPASNVVGVLEGTDPQLKNEVIVVGAHYDHLGRGGEGSLAAREGEIHHGADDNASGTAGLLELARLLSQDKDKLRRTVVFIAFGGEEEGLIGSSFYVASPARPIEQTVAMINMDMIGRLKNEALMIGGVGTASEWRGWVEEANKGFRVSVDPMGTRPQEASPARDTAADARQKNGSIEAPIIVTGSNGRVIAMATPAERFALRLNEDGFGPSDHSSFYAKRVPVLFFFTGSHEDYHKPSDTAERINYAGEARILEFIRGIIHDLQAAEKRPTFAVAKTEASARSTGFRVYLGTVPSYAESTDGMKLDAVREGSPAETAGLKAGDRIVKLAGRDIRNVYDYTQALSGMKAGQEYEVEIARGDERLTLKITPAARK
ncbi:MAG: M20/M25/M40 family metallo-hydrolase [Rubrivivax sp.]|nr:M20/M25/M40 family metallo-hydrolase [Pyrinomonadaceae bacterium]